MNNLNLTSLRELIVRLDINDPDNLALDIQSGRAVVSVLVEPFLGRTAAMSTAEFVRWLYFVFLNRSVDPIGLEGYVRAVDNEGASRRSVVDLILASAEFNDRMQSASDWWVDGKAPPGTEPGSELSKTWMPPEEDAIVPPRNLWIGAYDPIGHYYRWVWEYFAYLTLLCNLHRDARVLELGCAHGRTATALGFYLRTPGVYYGMDVDRRRIEDAQTRLTPRFPALNFVWADVHSSICNPTGKYRGDNFEFPFESHSFDVVYGASIFTHLLPGEAVNYLKQAQRVLKRGGKCLFSFYVLDFYAGREKNTAIGYEFDYQFEGFTGVAVKNPLKPQEIIAYSEQAIREACNQAGLRVCQVLPGLWSKNTPYAVNEQDLVLMECL